MLVPRSSPRHPVPSRIQKHRGLHLAFKGQRAEGLQDLRGVRLPADWHRASLVLLRQGTRGAIGRRRAGVGFHHHIGEHKAVRVGLGQVLEGSCEDAHRDGPPRQHPRLHPCDGWTVPRPQAARHDCPDPFHLLCHGQGLCRLRLVRTVRCCRSLLRDKGQGQHALRGGGAELQHRRFVRFARRQHRQADGGENRQALPQTAPSSGVPRFRQRRDASLYHQQLRHQRVGGCEHLPQPMADRGLLQVDQAEHRHQDVVGLFRKRSQDSPLGGHLRLSNCRENQGDLRHTLLNHRDTFHTPCLSTRKSQPQGTAFPS